MPDALAPMPGPDPETRGPRGPLVPLLVAGLVAVGGGAGSSWFFSRQMERRVDEAIAKAIAQAAPQTARPAGGGTDADARKSEPAPTPRQEAPKATARKEPARKPTTKAAREAATDAQQAAREAGLFQLGNEPIVANPAGTDGSRFVVCRITLESVDQADIGPAVEANMDRLKDAVTGYLADTSLETLQSRGFKGQLSTQLALAFNRILGPGTVKSVIIPQLVVQ